MAWGILEAASHPENHVPGTVFLEEQSENISAANIGHLRKVVHQNETIVLVPQPSDDPNDPLNMSLPKRDLRFLLFAYCGILTIGGSVVPYPCQFHRFKLT